MTDFTLVDGLFAELLTASGPYLTEDERVGVQELLDEAEYHLALEEFVHIFVDGGKSATDPVFSLILRLTDLLRVPLDDTLQRIPRLRE